jgi:hypothetical protein
MRPISGVPSVEAAASWRTARRDPRVPWCFPWPDEHAEFQAKFDETRRGIQALQGAVEELAEQSDGA